MRVQFLIPQTLSMGTVAPSEPRRSIRLKVKGKAGSSTASDRGRDAWTSGKCPLLDSFPYSRLTVDEVSELFRSYRIILGDNATHRDLILMAIQSSSRQCFENTIRQVIDKRKRNSYEFVIVYPKTNSDGLIEFE
jgi:hypothetical protein